MTVAEVGNIVEFYDGLRGRVEKINDNSVIVDLTIMDNFNELDLPEKTVINHKRYKIVEQEALIVNEKNIKSINLVYCKFYCFSPYLVYYVG